MDFQIGSKVEIVIVNNILVGEVIGINDAIIVLHTISGTTAKRFKLQSNATELIVLGKDNSFYGIYKVLSITAQNKSVVKSTTEFDGFINQMNTEQRINKATSNTFLKNQQIGVYA
jgi:hypothetical protein